MFKRAQVLRTNRAIKSVAGNELPAGTRVVILKQEENGSWRVKVQDPKLDKFRGERAVIGESRLGQTFRGRPLGSTKAASEPQI